MGKWIWGVEGWDASMETGRPGGGCVSGLDGCDGVFDWNGSPGGDDK